MEILRSPEGCPWDREQTHSTIAENLVEEAYEACQAIADQNDDSLKEELGDVLLQVVFHSQMAKERKAFDLTQVIESLLNKLYQRHPHVFGSEKLETAEEVLENWERLKKKEGGKRLFESLPSTLPALLRAKAVQERARRVGFDWPADEGVIEKVIEELKEFSQAKDKKELQAEMGDILFSLVNLARRKNINPEEALRQATEKFRRRLSQMEEEAEKKGLSLQSLSLEELDCLWEKAKESEGGQNGSYKKSKSPGNS